MTRISFYLLTAIVFLAQTPDPADLVRFLMWEHREDLMLLSARRRYESTRRSNCT
jgi:hypothetical protein